MPSSVSSPYSSAKEDSNGDDAGEDDGDAEDKAGSFAMAWSRRSGGSLKLPCMELTRATAEGFGPSPAR